MPPTVDHPAGATDKPNEAKATPPVDFQPLSGKADDLAIIRTQNEASKTQTAPGLPPFELSTASPAASSDNSVMQKVATDLAPYLPMDNHDPLAKAIGMYFEGGFGANGADALNFVMDIPADVKAYFDNSAAMSSAQWPPPTADADTGPKIDLPNRAEVDSDPYGRLGEVAVPLITSVFGLAANPELVVDAGAALAKGVTSLPKLATSIVKGLAEGDPSMGPSPEMLSFLQKARDEGTSVEQALTKQSSGFYEDQLPPLSAKTKTFLDDEFSKLDANHFLDDGEQVIVRAGQQGRVGLGELDSAFRYLTNRFKAV